MRSCLTIVGVFLAIVVVAALSTSWVVVYVDDRSEDFKIVVPAPVFLADIALQVGEAYVDDPELPAEAREALLMVPPLVEELAKAPDFELLRVEQPNLNVSVRKIGQMLDISVEEAEQTVHVKVPVHALERAAEAVSDGNLRIGELSGLLRGVSRTELVNVSMPDQDVRVWVW